MPQPFWIVATQNPLDVQGTYALPENQLDRFLMRLELGYPDAVSEAAIVLGGGAPVRPADLQPVITHEELMALMEQVKTIHAEPAIADYVVALCQATREQAHFVVGASTRAAVALLHACRSLAIVRGRTFVSPDDVYDLWLPVVGHRVVVTQGGRSADRKATDLALKEIARKVPTPD